MADIRKTFSREASPLDNRFFASDTICLKPGEPRARLSLRAGREQISAINQALTIKLPEKPKTSVTSGSRVAIWLGPDEWLILDEITSNLENMPVDLAGTPCSAVDISHRNVSIDLTGSDVANVINAGCPQNLSPEAFPAGACSRTVLGKVEIILLRMADDAFHIECWRSFSDYAWNFLAHAARTL